METRRERHQELSQLRQEAEKSPCKFDKIRCAQNKEGKNSRRKDEKRKRHSESIQLRTVNIG